MQKVIDTAKRLGLGIYHRKQETIIDYWLGDVLNTLYYDATTDKISVIHGDTLVFWKDYSDQACNEAFVQLLDLTF